MLDNARHPTTPDSQKYYEKNIVPKAHPSTGVLTWFILIYRYDALHTGDRYYINMPIVKKSSTPFWGPSQPWVTRIYNGANAEPRVIES